MCVVYLSQLEGKSFEVRPVVITVSPGLAYCLEYKGPYKQVLVTSLGLTFNPLTLKFRHQCSPYTRE